MSKRLDYETWDNTFMSIAKVIAKRSKDPSTQVGACIVSPDNRVVSLGYNGFPNGCNDDDVRFTWEKEDDKGNSKYLYVVHAELNAILNAKRDLSGCTLYVTHFPCNECTKAIIQSGIKCIIYDKSYDKGGAEASRKMLAASRVKYLSYQDKIQEKEEL
jgi:dCMP deaminase